MILQTIFLLKYTVDEIAEVTELTVEKVLELQKARLVKV
jgi:hypothetical protein